MEDQSFFFIQDENSVLLTATVIELQEDGDDEGVSRPASLGWEGGSPSWQLVSAGIDQSFSCSSHF